MGKGEGKGKGELGNIFEENEKMQLCQTVRTIYGIGFCDV